MDLQSLSLASCVPGPRQGAAVQQGKLPELWFEDEALGGGVAMQVQAGQVSDDLVVAAALARAECNGAFEASADQSSDAMLATVRAKSSHWPLMDADYHLEISLLESGPQPPGAPTSRAAPGDAQG